MMKTSYIEFRTSEEFFSAVGEFSHIRKTVAVNYVKSRY